jgi:hypothetical protein
MYMYIYYFVDFLEDIGRSHIFLFEIYPQRSPSNIRIPRQNYASITQSITHIITPANQIPEEFPNK